MCSFERSNPNRNPCDLSSTKDRRTGAGCRCVCTSRIAEGRVTRDPELRHAAVGNVVRIVARKLQILQSDVLAPQGMERLGRHIVEADGAIEQQRGRDGVGAPTETLLFSPSTGPSESSGGGAAGCTAEGNRRPSGNFRTLVSEHGELPDGFQLTFTSVEWRSNSAIPEAK